MGYGLHSNGSLSAVLHPCLGSMARALRSAARGAGPSGLRRSSAGRVLVLVWICRLGAGRPVGPAVRGAVPPERAAS